MNDNEPPTNAGVDRRQFLKLSATTAAAASIAGSADARAQNKSGGGMAVADDFDRPDSLYHGDGWETLNPGYWKVETRALRRRLKNVGDRPSGHWFPWHWETHRDQPMPMQYDPSLPIGMIWRRDWKLTGNYTLRIDATVRALRPDPAEGDDPGWRMHQPGYALMGVGFGSKSLHEGLGGGGRPGDAAWFAAWRDDQTFGVYDHASRNDQPIRDTAQEPAPPLKPGDRVTIEVAVTGRNTDTAAVTARFSAGDATATVELDDVPREKFTDGYFGLVARGLLDFEVNRVRLDPGENQPLHAPANGLHVCYPLGDTLRQDGGGAWRCKFIALFRSDGDRCEIRIADTPDPADGWQNVPPAGSAKIVNNDFRRNTAVLDAALPASPADTALYYTVWKDGEDVTADPRLGTDSVGPGTGFIGQTPSDGNYVGRLPRLQPPYRLCGLSCHALHQNNPNLPHAARYQAWWLNDQPTPGAYQHLDDYNFQVMLWEDDVWYLEHVFTPFSTDDAYKIITTTLAGPTTRWQMMRHWNVINPGDHDHGMDDVKGPEQIAMRTIDGLGQDLEYLQRNFQIVSHLMRANEAPSPTANPKRWRRWKMPGRDFTLLIMDSRLWRTSQDTRIWDDEGWGHKELGVYHRDDPTRALLGEEQFAWLQEVIQTDSSPLICLTGINGMHTIWTGWKHAPEEQRGFHPRDRVAADYAGWVSAGCDRVLEILGSRRGVLSVYGDVHNGMILRNARHRVYECSFGPIGRFGGRAPKPGFGPTMKDYDGRDVEIAALYHRQYQSPTLEPITGPKYWNFLEMQFNPAPADPEIHLTLRNLVDPPDETPRGGNPIRDLASNTARPHTCKLPPIKTLPNADILFATSTGRTLRGARSQPDGTIPLQGLIDVNPNTNVVMTAYTDTDADAKIIRTLPV